MATGLDRLAELDDDELDALIEIAQARASGALSRRGLLKAGGTLGALGLVGGSAVGSSAADASTSDSDSNAGRPSDRVDVFADGVDATSVSTNEGQVTNETFVRLTRSSDTASTSAGDFVNLFDGKSKDNRGEFNSSQEFSPEKDGEYIIIVNPDIRGSTTDGDDIIIEVYNVTDSTFLIRSRAEASSAESPASVVFAVNLDSGNNYELRATNLDSSFYIDTDQTTGVIKRSLIQS